MRRFGKLLRAMVQRHVAVTAGLAAATVAIVGVLLVAALTGAFNAPTPVADKRG